MVSTSIRVATGRDICMQMHPEGSHVTQVASDFPNKLPPRESRVPETFIDTLLCTRTHTRDNGPTWSFNPFSASLLAGCTSGPHFMLVMPLFPESVYYHRPVSSFMQNNLISRASKSRYNAHTRARTRRASLFAASLFHFCCTIAISVVSLC